MACVKQFARPIFYDPEIRKQEYDMKDFTGIYAASDAELLAADNEDVTDSSSGGGGTLGVSGSGLNDSAKEVCNKVNREYSKRETDCVSELEKERTNFMTVCAEVSKAVVDLHENACKACSETGMVQQQCRKAYDRGRLAPEAWWRGPAQKVENPLPSSGIKFLEGETEQKFNKKKDKEGKELPPSKEEDRSPEQRCDEKDSDPEKDAINYPLNVDVQYLLTEDLQRCESGEDNKYWGSHLTLNRSYPRNIHTCKEWTEKHYASTKRNQDKRNENREDDEEDNDDEEGVGNSNPPRTTPPSGADEPPSGRNP